MSFENDTGMPFLLFDRIPPIHHASLSLAALQVACWRNVCTPNWMEMPRKEIHRYHAPTEDHAQDLDLNEDRGRRSCLSNQPASGCAGVPIAITSKTEGDPKC